MTINLHLPNKNDTLRPTITVVGVGGAGGNAVNNMISANLEGVSFVVANTDHQALENSQCQRRIQLGSQVTRGLGAGASPDVGRASAEEALEEVADAIEGSNMVFITAGMGGGTGTGAAPVIARMAREQGILTVGVVTKPFHFEGTHRMKLAESGLAELQNYVDTLIVIPNQNLFRVATEKTTFADAFKMADEVLHSGVRGVTDLIVKPGLVNLDFADIRTVMREMGKAMMGTGEATGDRRAIDAAEAAISNPLLDDVSLKGARAVLINITGGMDMTLFEVDEAANRIRAEVDPDANIIFGSTFHETMDGKMRVSVVATGIDAASARGSQSGSSANSGDKKVVSMPAAAPAAAAKAAPFKPSIVAAATTEAPVFTAPAQPQPVAAEPVQQAGFNFPPATPQAPAPTYGTAYNESYSPPREPQLFTNAPAAPRAPQSSTYSGRGQESSGQYGQGGHQNEASFGRRQDDSSASQNASMSFFQKVASMGKAMTAKPNESAPEPQPHRGPQVTDRQTPTAAPGAPRTAAQEEQYMDIPAFLRRQAN